MKTLFYSTKEFEYPFIVAANHAGLDLQFTPVSLSLNTVDQAEGCNAVCISTTDCASAEVLKELRSIGVRYVALRSAEYDHIDLHAAAEAGITVAFVPAYSPNAVAEHTIALMLSLSRRLIPAHEQAKRNDFRLNNLIGFNLQGKKVGIIGTGSIGSAVAGILYGFKCELLAYDVNYNDELAEKYGVQYTSLKQLCNKADIITIHTPLTKQTRYLVDADFLEEVQQGVMLINTSHGMIVNTAAVFNALDEGVVGALGLDVYENENGIFFTDRYSNPPEDEMLRKLMHMPNVLITPHQAFATKEALQKIAEATIYNLNCFDSASISSYQLAAGVESCPNNLDAAYMLF